MFAEKQNLIEFRQDLNSDISKRYIPSNGDRRSETIVPVRGKEEPVGGGSKTDHTILREGDAQLAAGLYMDGMVWPERGPLQPA